MKFAFALIIVSILLYASGCGIDKSNTKSTQITFSVDSIQIEIDSTQLNTYDTYGFNEALSLFVGYNEPLSSFEIFSFEDRKLIHQIPVRREGPDGIGRIEGITLIDSTTVLVQEYGHLKILDSKGHIIKDHNYAEQIDKKHELIGNPISNQYVPLRYSSTTQSVLLFSVRESYFQKKETPLLLYNLTTNSFTTIPVEFPEHYLKNKGKYGFLNYTNGSVIEDTLVVYNHLYDPSIYTYSPRTGLSRKYPQTDSEFSIKPLLTTNSIDEWQQYALENTHYLEVIYDPYRKLYYQFIWKSTPYKKSNTEFNTFLEKELLLKVFNPRFEQIGEHNLPGYTYQPFSWFLSKKGLCISNTHPKNKNSSEQALSFHVITCQENPGN